MDTARCWPQEIGLVKTMEETMMVSTAAAGNTSGNPNLAGAINTTQRAPQVMERRARPQKEQALNCPRCNSTNTKFCYYNNYSLTQPRYFCKTCRRYWTEGGSLRNVPVGGGSRKNKRTSSSNSAAATASSTSATTASATTSMRLNPSSPSSSQNPKFHEGQDLNLSFPQFPSLDNPTNPSAVSAMELLRSARALPQFLPMPPVAMAETGAGAVYSPGFGLHDHHQLRPPIAFNFPLENNTSNYGGMQDQNINNSAATGRLLFPFEDLRQIPTTTNSANNAEFKQQDTRSGQHGAGDQPGTFWNHMMGGGTSW